MFRMSRQYRRRRRHEGCHHRYAFCDDGSDDERGEHHDECDACRLRRCLQDCCAGVVEAALFIRREDQGIFIDAAGSGRRFEHLEKVDQ